MSPGFPKGVAAALWHTILRQQSLVCYACPRTNAKMCHDTQWNDTFEAAGKRGGNFERPARKLRLVFGEEGRHRLSLFRKFGAYFF